MEPFLWCGIGFFLSDRESRVLSRPRRHGGGAAAASGGRARLRLADDADCGCLLLVPALAAARGMALVQLPLGLLLSVLRFVLPWFLVLRTISCLQISESEGFYLLTIESVYYHVNFNKKE